VRIVTSLNEGIEKARAKTVETGDCLEGVHASTQNLLGASETIFEEVSGIASSTEELAHAAKEIANTVDQVQLCTKSAMQSAENSAQDIEGLAVAVSEIGTILASIGEIAQRTNLLALNATIEAARAGEAGRGFAVVAQEVKALSVGASQAVSAIRQRMDALQNASDRAVGGMRRITMEIGEITPICTAIGQATDEQRDTVADLARRINGSQAAVSTMKSSVEKIFRMTDEARAISASAGTLNQASAVEASNLGRRVITILRSTEMADRRKSERFPIDLAMRLKHGSSTLACRSFDLSEGGVLIKPQDGLSPAIGTRIEAEISRIGQVQLNIVNLSPLGVHCAFERLAAPQAEMVKSVIEEFQRAHAPLVARAHALADDISAAIQGALDQRRLTLAAVFDTDYQRIERTDPPQFRTLYLDIFDSILPPILERTLKLDANMVFCLAIDRNGYIPVHNQKVSQAQRPNDPVWNNANARNRRFFDDRTGLIAARLTRPYLIQTYSRDMGNQVRVLMKEIDAPLRINDRHWGGIRMAYTL
jgi:methyl-accepting chemotaxis protein